MRYSQPVNRQSVCGWSRCRPLHRLYRLLLAGLLSLLSAPLAEAWQAPADRPNIILIMSDDMGYSDLGCYGGEIQTPHLDGLAENGLRFTQFYNVGRCCPTRASLLTGLYPHQTGIGHMTEDNGLEAYRGDLNRRCQTIAEVLGPAGYRTYMAGKWHVTKAISPEGPKDNWPLQRGFERFYGTIIGAGSFYDPYTLCRNNTFITPENDPEYHPDVYYYTDAITDNAIRFLADHQAESSDPFFMYVAYTAAHWPMHALPEDIAKYEGKYDDGYEPIRRQRYQRLLELGLIDSSDELSPADADWEKTKNHAWESRCMEVYAAMVDRMDQGIGKIVDQLRTSGELDNTLILFLQDNGGCAEGMGRDDRESWHLTDLQPLGPDELQTTLWPPMQTRDGRPVLGGPNVMPGPADTYIAYGRGWANVSNTPFRLYKHYVHEGGISTPLIAHWPKGIQRTGQLERQPSHLIDVMATCVDLAQATYPASKTNDSTDTPGDIHPLEGRSLVPAFQGDAIERDALYWEHEGNRAVRVGDWKLVAKGADGPWELYDLSQDRSELHDLASEYPERVEELAQKFNLFGERTGVFPLTPWRRRSQEVQFNRKQTRFQLKSGDELTQNQAPYVIGRDVRLKGTFEYRSADGILLAHGGSSHGYALYVYEDALEFAVRQAGELKHWRMAERLSEGDHELSLVYPAEGELVIVLDGRRVVETQTPGSLVEMPIDGLQVGTDQGGLVGRAKSDVVLEDVELVLELTQ